MGASNCTSRSQEITSGRLPLAGDERSELEQLRAVITDLRSKGIIDVKIARAPSPRPSNLADKLKRASERGDNVPEFLNQMLAYLWPHISKFVTETIITTVQPKVQQALPGPLQSSFSFDEDHCHLGQTPLQFPYLGVDQTTQPTEDGDIEVLTLRSSIAWNSELDVLMRMAGVSVGVQKLVVKGDLYVEFVGLLDAPPFFQGIRLFFTNIPEMNLSFQGALAGLNMAVIKRKILDVVEDGLKGALVLPERLGFALAEGADIFHITSPRPQGRLKFCVHKADGLKALDSHLLSAASSDPFIVVSLGPTSTESPVITANLNPVFEYTTCWPISSVDCQRLCIKLFDKDFNPLGGDNDLLGSLTIVIADCLAWGPGKQVTLKLKDDEGKDEACGTITMSAEFRPLQINSDKVDEAGFVFAGVYTASQVQGQCEGMQYWIKATFTDGGEPTIKASAKVRPACAKELEGAAKIAENEAFQERVAILRKYNVPLEDMAKVLQKEPDIIDPSVQEQSAEGHAKHSVTFNSPFEFQTENVSKATVVLELMGVDKNGNERSFGTVSKTASDLAQMRNFTFAEEVKFDGGAFVSVCIQLLYLGNPHAMEGK